MVDRSRLVKLLNMTDNHRNATARAPGKARSRFEQQTSQLGPFFCLGNRFRHRLVVRDSRMPNTPQ